MSTILGTLTAPRAAVGRAFGPIAPRWRALLQTVVAAWRRPADPGDGAVREAARQAAAVRELADRYRRSDPGFASDLYAAADRYERTFDRIN